MANPLLLITVAAAGVLLLGQKRKAKTTSSSGDDALPFDDTPEPPMLGAAPCYKGLVATKSKLGQGVLSLMNPAARTYVTPPYGSHDYIDEKGQLHTHEPQWSTLSKDGQVLAFKEALVQLGIQNRSTLSIATRNVLKALMPECNWDADLWPSFGRPSFSKVDYNLWVSVWYMVNAAARQVNYKFGGSYPAKSIMIPYGGGPGRIIGLGFLNLPDIGVPGNVNLEYGRRVELIGGDYKAGQMPIPPFFHAEPIFARVIDSKDGRPTVEILATFRGKDVTPKFSHIHGFEVGRRLRMPGSGTTGLRRIFPEGMT